MIGPPDTTELDEEELDLLDLRIYVSLLESEEPVGVRDLARKLNVPASTVHYRVKKLERLNLLKEEGHGYKIIGRVSFKNYVVIWRKVVPKFFVYSSFFLGLLMGEVFVIINRGSVTPDSIVALIASFLAFLFFVVEGRRLRQKLLGKRARSCSTL